VIWIPRIRAGWLARKSPLPGKYWSRFLTYESASEDAVELQDGLRRIRAALDGVGIRTREIYLAHRAGYSYAEIAEHLNISLITVKRYIARALLAIMERGEL
jgi:RNA polymerase sigma factor (sigma-70 family)